MKNRSRYSAVKKPVSREGKLSLILAVVSASAFLFCVIVSFLSGGNGGTFIGAVSLASTLLALYGCVTGIHELATSEKMYKKLYSGAIFSGLVFIMWLTIFIRGLKG